MADRWTYRPELDGLRSVAVYLVVLFHCGLGPFDGGFVGVDLFFVLSGFLVSHVIWAEVDKHGSFRLGWFYARRVRRLLPAAVLAIVATAAVQLLVASAPQRQEMLRDGQSALVYLSNWHFIADSRDYFAADATSESPFLHYWSLSIEEQFYVVLPLALLAPAAAAPTHRGGARSSSSPSSPARWLSRCGTRRPTRPTPTTRPRRGSTSSRPGCCSPW